MVVMTVTHARMRALQRFGVMLTEPQIAILEDIIRSGTAEAVPGMRYVGKRKGASLWEVELWGKRLIAVYRRSRIATFLYPDWIEPTPQ